MVNGGRCDGGEPVDLGILVAKAVDSAIAQRTKEYRGKLRWFLVGLGILVILLVANGLMSKQAILVLLHDQLFGIDLERLLDDEFADSASVSYNNQFILSTLEGYDRAQDIPFYAHASQQVEARITILHQGTGEILPIRLRLDDELDTVWPFSGDVKFFHLDLTGEIREHHDRGERPLNIHELHFELDESGHTTDDRAFVTCLITVYGREKKGGISDDGSN